MLSLFLVDDQPLTRRGMASLLAAEAGFSLCGQAADGAEALALLAGLSPDLIVTEVVLPNMSGLEFIRRARVLRPHTPILVVTDRADVFCAERALHAGARGYVLKHEPFEHVPAAIHRVLAGGFYLCAEMLDALLHALVENRQMVVAAPPDLLSERELTVFEQIGQGCTTRQIADALALSAKTVESYRNRIKAKLHVAATPDLVQRAVRWVEVRAQPRCTCYREPSHPAAPPLTVTLSQPTADASGRP